MKVSVPTPPIHAPAWIICRLSKFHEFKMEDNPNSMETCQREHLRAGGSPGRLERDRRTTEAGWRLVRLATAGRRLAAHQHALNMALSCVEHLRPSMTSHQEPKRPSVSIKG